MRRYIIVSVVGCISAIVLCALTYAFFYLSPKNDWTICHAYDDSIEKPMEKVWASHNELLLTKAHQLNGPLQWLYFVQWYLEYVGAFLFVGAVLLPLGLYMSDISSEVQKSNAAGDQG